MSYSLDETAKMIARLKLGGYKIQAFDHGWSCEVDGLQIFRAVDTGAARYDVRINREVFPDV